MTAVIMYDTSLNHFSVSLLRSDGLDLMERMFQGRLVLRTRCLECESFTERREDFQDISVPVLDDQPSSPDDLSEGEESTATVQSFIENMSADIVANDLGCVDHERQIYIQRQLGYLVQSIQGEMGVSQTQMFTLCLDCSFLSLSSVTRSQTRAEDSEMGHRPVCFSGAYCWRGQVLLRDLSSLH